MLFEKVVEKLRIAGFVVGKWYKISEYKIILPILVPINSMQYIENKLLIHKTFDIMEQINDFIYRARRIKSTKELGEDIIEDMKYRGVSVNFNEWERM